MTIQQLQAFVDTKPEIREIVNEIVDYIQANPAPEIPEIPVLPLDDIDIYQLLGSQVKGEPVGLSVANITNATPMVDGSVYFIVMKVKKPITITGVKFFQGGSTGNYTADNYNGIGLYTISNGTLTLVRSSTNDGNIWKGTLNGWYSKAFSQNYAAAAGVYVAALLYNSSAQTTAPNIGQCASMGGGSEGSSLDFTNGVKLHGSLASQASLPSSVNMSALTSEPSKRMYVAFY